MAKKCFRCGSEDLIKIVPASALVIPEIKKEVEQGLAKANCGCTGFQTGHRTKCKSCGFEWDYLIERQMEEQNKIT